MLRTTPPAFAAAFVVFAIAAYFAGPTLTFAGVALPYTLLALCLVSPLVALVGARRAHARDGGAGLLDRVSHRLADRARIALDMIADPPRFTGSSALAEAHVVLFAAELVRVPASEVVPFRTLLDRRALLALAIMVLAGGALSISSDMRLGAYALGATRWEAIRHHVFLMALPGILTGTILALSRAIGEAAPVILVGALGFVAFVPDSPLDQYTVLPFQIFNWVSRPQPEFHRLAAGASIVLLVLLLAMNAAAIWLRNRYSRKY